MVPHNLSINGNTKFTYRQSNRICSFLKSYVHKNRKSLLHIQLLFTSNVMISVLHAFLRTDTVH